MALKEKPSKAYQAHLDAITSGMVERTNIIGIRKLLNGAARRERGYSVGMCTPLGTIEQANALVEAIHTYKPRAVGDLMKGGRKVLTDPRHRKVWGAREARVIENLAAIRLVDFSDQGGMGFSYYVPVWEAVGVEGASFQFINIPWQSGGRGPEIVD